MAFKTFAPGVLTSSDLNTYFMQQAVITCTSGARPSSPVEGMTIYETDTDRYATWSGSAWEAGDYPGAWRSYDATLISGGAGTDWAIGNGTVVSKYCRVNRLVGVWFRITFGTTTTFGTKFLNISLPFNTTFTTEDVYAGNSLAKDTSAGTNFALIVGVIQNRASFGALAASGTYASFDQVRSTVPMTWASTDVLSGSFYYETDA